MIIHNKLINPKKLHIFSVVADLRNITHAAQKLNLSQPAISNSLLSLEQFFGLKLYEVVGREVMITSIGKRILKHWSNIASDYQKMFDEFGELDQGESGDIAIAMISSGKYFMLKLRL